MKTRGKTWIIGVVVVLGIVGGVFAYRQKRSKPAPTVFVVRRAPLVQEVSVTGKVKSAKNVDLAFERGGKIARIAVAVGDSVKTGQLLTTLGMAELQAQWQQYEAAVETQRAKLQELVRGTRPEEIVLAEIKVANSTKAFADAEANLLRTREKADVDLANLYDDIPDVVRDGYTKVDDAINKQVDEFFTNDTSSRPQLTFSTEAQTKIDVETGRVTAGDALLSMQARLASLSSDHSLLDASLSAHGNELTRIRTFLLRLSDALNASIGLSATTLASYKTNLNTALANSNTATAAINDLQQKISAQQSSNAQAFTTAEGKVNDARNAVATANGELSLKKAGAPLEQIAAAKAQVRQAEANLQSSAAEIAKASLVAPFDGIVTKMDAEAGEIIAPNIPLVSLISATSYDIETFIPEADVAKVEVSDAATVTLDAYGNDVVFGAKIVRSDPAETMIDGIATYRTTLQFTKDDERIKSGMTANITIATDERTQALIVPQRLIRTKDGNKVVRLLRGDTEEDVVVVTGLRGSDGNVEIVIGVTEGDRIVSSNE